MFESLPTSEVLSEMDDAALVAAMVDYARIEAMAGARRLAVIGEFTARRMAAAEHADWVVDDWAAASAEIGAALNISPGCAGGQMDLALTLRDRLPNVAALYAGGGLVARTVAMIARRTDLVQDPAALAALDSALAERAVAWGPLSERKLEQAVDVWVIATDPDALHRTHVRARDREFGIGDPGDGEGVTTVWGRLLATDAKLLDARLTAMARAVCDADPRTLAQRRADALGALGAGSGHLACRCGVSDCSAAVDDGRGSHIVVHVLADVCSVDTPPDPGCHGPRRREPDRAPIPPAVIAGGPVLPAELLADVVEAGAKVRPLRRPADDPAPGYRPSRAQDEWVRMRDLTCRAPGCDRPAVAADVDHTVPWPAGPTHPSNTKCYCRFHHLVKTFWPGFADWQDPDGTVTWTTPTGHSYTTYPLGSVLFPGWDTATAALAEPGPTPPAGPGRDAMMPKRKRTRATEREYRVNTERAANHAENIPPF